MSKALHHALDAVSNTDSISLPVFGQGGAQGALLVGPARVPEKEVML
jgi:hypothetical protein